jgi:hypothetical protein
MRQELFFDSSSCAHQGNVLATGRDTVIIELGQEIAGKMLMLECTKAVLPNQSLWS